MSDSTGPKPFPELETFMLETSLYKCFVVPEIGLRSIEFFNGSVRAFCFECNGISVFKRNAPVPGNSPGPKPAFDPFTAGTSNSTERSSNVFVPPGLKTLQEEKDKEKIKTENRVFILELRCAVNSEHRLFFCFRVYHGEISKIGQYPSLADLASGDLKKYRKILGNKYGEFSRAIGLYANGIGIGSFVYLRRIFEDLLEQAHQEVAKKPDWNEDVFKNSRWDGKIDLLASELPEFLVQNKRIYSILSLGIHELDEEICKQNFPLMRTGIELILDEKIERAERAAKIEAARKGIQNFKYP